MDKSFNQYKGQGELLADGTVVTQSDLKSFVATLENKTAKADRKLKKRIFNITVELQGAIRFLKSSDEYIFEVKTLLDNVKYQDIKRQIDLINELISDPSSLKGLRNDIVKSGTSSKYGAVNLTWIDIVWNAKNPILYESTSKGSSTELEMIIPIDSQEALQPELEQSS